MSCVLVRHQQQQQRALALDGGLYPLVVCCLLSVGGEARAVLGVRVFGGTMQVTSAGSGDESAGTATAQVLEL